MALIPAAVALDVATKISQRYELEMSKVRNRLPMLLGLIFFDRRQQFEYPENSGQHGIDVRNVQNGDTIQFTPSRFTWLHLDTSARRFEAGRKMHPQ